LKDILRMMRPHQWVKNLFIFPALIFSRHLTQPEYVLKSIAAFALFCLISGAIYIFNDLMDYEEDRHHPVKRLRPIAAGRISKWLAWVLFVAFSVFGLTMSYILNMGFGLIATFYFIINVLYSSYLKRIAIIDVLIISIGFVIRAAAGGLVLSVEVSPWLLVCTILLALFLVLAKRRHEITVLDERTRMLVELSLAVESPGKAFKYRRSLDDYSTYFLDQMIAVSTASTLMAYILYTLSDDAIRKFGGTKLVYTVPFVIYGIFRYLYLIHLKKEGGNPSRTLMNDAPLLANIILWGVSTIIILYFF
jgi:MFS family permease